MDRSKPTKQHDMLNKPEKHGRPRPLKVLAKLMSTLQNMYKKNELIFGTNNTQQKENIFLKQKRKIAQKIGNPRFEKITFHTIRHWKGTTEYHRTHDPDHVKRLLGHRNLQSTEIYIKMEQALFTDSNDNFHVKVAKNLDEACKLLEVGFEYVRNGRTKTL